MGYLGNLKALMKMVMEDSVALPTGGFVKSGVGSGLLIAGAGLGVLFLLFGNKEEEKK